MWRQGEAPPAIRRAILSQINMSKPYPEIDGMNTDMVSAPTDREIMLYTVNNGAVRGSPGRFRDDNEVWGFVLSTDPDTEVNAIGWSEL